MERGYYLVYPDFGVENRDIDDDTKARMLAYLMHRMHEFADVPSGIGFEIVPAKYLGPAYPAIGLYDVSSGLSAKELGHLALGLAEQLENYCRQVGVRWLRETSAGEDVRWQEILARLKMIGQ